MYKGFGLTETLQQSSYREIFRNELEPDLLNEIRNATNGNFVLGETALRSRLAIL